MASDQHTTVRLISKLTELTSKGELTWEITDPPHALRSGTNDVFPLFFEVNFKGQHIGLANRRYQDYDGERDKYYWAQELVLMFIDQQGRVVWTTTSPYAAIYNLFETVREQVADVKNIIDNLLDDEN
jgi:hypothetical protein